MIEVRNLIKIKNKGKKDEEAFRLHVKQTWTAIGVDNDLDDDNEYTGAILGCNQNGCFRFDTYEKAEKFYDAFKALLPDSDSQNAVIDHKDFE